MQRRQLLGALHIPLHSVLLPEIDVCGWKPLYGWFLLVCGWQSSHAKVARLRQTSAGCAPLDQHQTCSFQYTSLCTFSLTFLILPMLIARKTLGTIVTNITLNIRVVPWSRRAQEWFTNLCDMNDLCIDECIVYHGAIAKVAEKDSWKPYEWMILKAGNYQKN